MGLTWYTWLEQGRAISVTTSVLDAVAGALRLDGTERAHLYRLAGHEPRPHRTAPPRDPHPADAAPGLPAAVVRVLDGWLPHPAYVLDRHWRFLGGNTALHALFGDLRPGISCLDGFTGKLPGGHRPANWDQLAPQLVAGFRTDAARYPDDPEFPRVVTELSTADAGFAELWRRQEVRDTAVGAKTLDHPTEGRLHFDRTTVHLADHPDLHLSLLLPAADTGDERPAPTG